MVSNLICVLVTQGMTMAYMDGRPNVYVRRCTYQCERGVKKVHQIYSDDQCPKRIRKNTRSLYRGY
jgi:hypothetical protein